MAISRSLQAICVAKVSGRGDCHCSGNISRFNSSQLVKSCSLIICKSVIFLVAKASSASGSCLAQAFFWFGLVFFSGFSLLFIGRFFLGLGG